MAISSRGESVRAGPQKKPIPAQGITVEAGPVSFGTGEEGNFVIRKQRFSRSPSRKRTYVPFIWGGKKEGTKMKRQESEILDRKRGRTGQFKGREICFSFGAPLSGG